MQISKLVVVLALSTAVAPGRAASARPANPARKKCAR